MITVFKLYVATCALFYSAGGWAAIVDDFVAGSGMDIVRIEGALKAVLYVLLFVFAGWVMVSKLRSFSENATTGSQLVGTTVRVLIFSLVVILIIL